MADDKTPAYHIEISDEYESALEKLIFVEKELKLSDYDYLLFPLDKEKCLLITDDDKLAMFFTLEDTFGRELSSQEWRILFKKGIPSFSKMRGNLDLLSRTDWHH